jgi:hypothetical protein
MKMKVWFISFALSTPTALHTTDIHKEKEGKYPSTD